MLSEVENDGEILILMNDRRLRVNPGDMPTACTWTPTAELEITDSNCNEMFPVTVRNIGIEIEIKAMWL